MSQQPKTNINIEHFFIRGELSDHLFGLGPLFLNIISCYVLTYQGIKSHLFYHSVIYYLVTKQIQSFHHPKTHRQKDVRTIVVDKSNLETHQNPDF